MTRFGPSSPAESWARTWGEHPRRGAVETTRKQQRARTPACPKAPVRHALMPAASSSRLATDAVAPVVATTSPCQGRQEVVPRTTPGRRGALIDAALPRSIACCEADEGIPYLSQKRLGPVRRQIGQRRVTGAVPPAQEP